MGPLTVEGFLNLSASKPQGVDSSSTQQNTSEGPSFKDSLAAAIAGGNPTEQPSSTQKSIELQLKDLGFDDAMIASLISLFEKLEEQIEQLDPKQLEWLAQSLLDIEEGELVALQQQTAELEGADNKQSSSFWHELVLKLSSNDDEESDQKGNQEGASLLDKLIALIQNHTGENKQENSSNQDRESRSDLQFLKPLEVTGKSEATQASLADHKVQSESTSLEHKVQVSESKIQTNHDDQGFLQTKVSSKTTQTSQDGKLEVKLPLSEGQKLTAEQSNTNAESQSSGDVDKTQTHQVKSTGPIEASQKPTTNVLDKAAAVIRQVVMQKVGQETEVRVEEGSKIHSALKKLITENPVQAETKLAQPGKENSLALAASLAQSQKTNPLSKLANETQNSNKSLELTEYQLLKEEVKVQSSNPRVPRVLQKVSLAYGLPQQTPLKIQTQASITQEFELPLTEQKVQERLDDRPVVESTNIKTAEVSTDKGNVETQNTTQNQNIEDSKVQVKSRYGQELVEKFLQSTRESLKLWVSKKLVGMQIQIDPPELGKIQLRTAIENGKIGVSIHAETVVAKELLNAHVQDMKDILKEQGLDVTGFSIDIDNNDQNGQNPFNSNNIGSSKFNMKSLLGEAEEETDIESKPSSNHYFDRVA